MPTVSLFRCGTRTALTFAAVLAASLSALPASAQRPTPRIQVSIPGGPAGADVTIRVAGLTPGLRLQLGFGGLSTNHEVLTYGEADADGNFLLTSKIPEWVERHRVYRFFLAYAGAPPASVSDPFIATAPDGFVRVAGSVSAAAAGCTQVKGFDETVYTLIGETGALQAGGRVVVEGTVSGTEAQPAPQSACPPGPAIPVRVRQVLPG
jgi:hypothetical protein